MTTTTSRTNKRWGVGGFAVVAAMAMLASGAWACTTIMGQIKICSPSTGTCTDTAAGSRGSGAPGSTIKVTAQGLIVKPATYRLFIADRDDVFVGGGDRCHSATTILKTPGGVLLNNMTTNKQGNLDRDLATAGIQPYKAAIPADAALGDAVICARERTPQAERSATQHATFTIVGA